MPKSKILDHLRSINLKSFDANGGSKNKKSINEVHALRKSLGLSQAKFAETYGLPLGTVRNWEQKEDTKPDSAARIILNMIKIDPEGVAKLIAQTKDSELI